jgi:PAS domain S-box-containing protein
MQAILESIADGIFSVNRDGEITHFNPSMEKITGFSSKEVLGKKCKSVLKGSACSSDCPVRWSVGEGERVETCRETITSCDGRAIPVHLTTSPIFESGVVTGVVCSVNDRTEIELLKNELAETTPFREIVGISKPMCNLYTSIKSASDTEVNVIIEGETGTGKELVARAIHLRSNRKHAPFVFVNCSVLPLFLLESELFGHVKGAFTGAYKDKKGKFEAAEGGTLFLDEISEISHEIQIKLLRFLQSKEFEMVGETKTRKVDVRIIAATNKNMAKLVKSGEFREDLFYRLNVFPIIVPPLRERKEDIPLLVEYFLDKHRRVNKDIEGLSSRAFKHLIEYHWPGNVRQLENAVMFSMASCPTKRIGRSFLPPEISKISQDEKPSLATRLIDDHDAMSIEKMRIVRALKEHNWHVTKTAGSLSYSRTTLWRRMKNLSITLPNRKAI